MIGSGRRAGSGRRRRGAAACRRRAGSGRRPPRAARCARRSAARRRAAGARTSAASPTVVRATSSRSSSASPSTCSANSARAAATLRGELAVEPAADGGQGRRGLLGAEVGGDDRQRRAEPVQQPGDLGGQLEAAVEDDAGDLREARRLVGHQDAEDDLGPVARRHDDARRRRAGRARSASSSRRPAARAPRGRAAPGRRRRGGRRTPASGRPRTAAPSSGCSGQRVRRHAVAGAAPTTVRPVAGVGRPGWRRRRTASRGCRRASPRPCRRAVRELGRASRPGAVEHQQHRCARGWRRSGRCRRTRSGAATSV